MMVLFEDLKVLQAAEKMADGLWKEIIIWEDFQRETIGKQLTRAADSVGANIAEAYGRYHYGEKLQFLYYARGSLFETKYWLNRIHTRNLLADNQTQTYADLLSTLAFQLNTFSKSIKEKRLKSSKVKKEIRETQQPYQLVDEYVANNFISNNQMDLFTHEEIKNLKIFTSQ